MYHLLVPLSDELPGANVFRYITFRTAWGLITALLSPMIGHYFTFMTPAAFVRRPIRRASLFPTVRH